MIERNNQSDLYGGCLSYLKQIISFSIPTGHSWNGDPYDLVGNPEVQSTYVQNNGPPQWFSISFDGKFIKPTAYAIQGRLQTDNNHLQNWTFEGLNIVNEWKILHQNDAILQFKTILVSQISSDDLFTSFRINMTGPNSGGNYILNLGQIDVYGFIYDSSYIPSSSYSHQSIFFPKISIIFIISSSLPSLVILFLFLIS